MSPTQADLANWVAAIGQCAGAVATFGAVLVALSIARSDRRDRAVSQARSVTFEVTHPPNEQVGFLGPAQVVITNDSDQLIRQPRIVRITGTTKPRNTRSGPWRPADWGEGADSSYRPINVLIAGASHSVPFTYSYTGDPGDLDKIITARSVTIAFTDAAGLRWQRTGHDEPVRVYHG